MLWPLVPLYLRLVALLSQFCLEVSNWEYLISRVDRNLDSWIENWFWTLIVTTTVLLVDLLIWSWIKVVLMLKWLGLGSWQLWQLNVGRLPGIIPAVECRVADVMSCWCLIGYCWKIFLMSFQVVVEESILTVFETFDEMKLTWKLIHKNFFK